LWFFPFLSRYISESNIKGMNKLCDSFRTLIAITRERERERVEWNDINIMAIYIKIGGGWINVKGTPFYAV
jgi:hypothetical protein